MQLTFIRQFKSITYFPVAELPNFTVLTGFNGAGKSHLLSAIENGSVQIDGLVNQGNSVIRRYDATTLIPNDTGAVASYQIIQEIGNMWGQILQMRSATPLAFPLTLESEDRAVLSKLSARELSDINEASLMASGKNPAQATTIISAISSATNEANRKLIANAQRVIPNGEMLIEFVQKKAGRPLLTIEENEFYNSIPINWNSTDIFQQAFSRLFAGYHRNWLANELKKLADSHGEKTQFLSPEEFLEAFGEPPWDFVNKILEVAHIDFRIDQPIKFEDRPYEPVLEDQITKARVKFSDLSSGEKILMSFALCLYNSRDSRQSVSFPKILLFDEIDAPLHPSMTQSLIKTITDVLVGTYGLKVILATHSPSTVALSPEASLYVMFKSGQDRIQKTSKDKALSILTTGVPTLSIDYRNRRQVFVESQYDVGFYEMIYERIKHLLVPGISLSFISSGVSGKGSCEQVMSVVNLLYSGGSLTVYGIIDWDLKNKDDERIKVLGEGERYSIENHLFDPLVVAVYLLREKFIERNVLGLDNAEVFTDIVGFDKTRLQNMADYILSEVAKHVSPNVNTTVSELSYICGMKVFLPEWFLRIQGHKLEEHLKDAFPKLRRHNKEGQFKKDIIEKVFDDLPELIPSAFLTLFKKIQNVP